MVGAHIDPGVTVAIVAAAVGPVGAYMIAARRMSGKIANSDAEQLWAESKAIREWSAQRIDEYEAEIKELREALSQVSRRCSDLEAENRELRDQLKEAKLRIDDLVELVSNKRRTGGE